jgi:pimeloyl-ACP methyl ester carboxylesterase
MRISVQDLEIEYEKSGERPPIILVHGGGLDLETWEDMVSDLDTIFTVYRFDMRGFGKAVRLSDKELSMSIWADDLRGVWERRNEVGRSGFGVIPEGCDTYSGVTDVEPDRPRAA